MIHLIFPTPEIERVSHAQIASLAGFPKRGEVAGNPEPDPTTTRFWGLPIPHPDPEKTEVACELGLLLFGQILEAMNGARTVSKAGLFDAGWWLDLTRPEPSTLRLMDLPHQSGLTMWRVFDSGIELQAWIVQMMVFGANMDDLLSMPVRVHPDGRVAVCGDLRLPVEAINCPAGHGLWTLEGVRAMGFVQ